MEFLQDYGFRLYNPAIGKFLSVDPLSPKYPELTPYQFASNRPIQGTDLDGLEFLAVNHPVFNQIPYLKVPNNGALQFEYDLKYKRITIAGQEFYDIGKQLYYRNGGLSDNGTRAEQATEATRVGVVLTDFIAKLGPRDNNHVDIDYKSTTKADVELSKQQALIYKDCGGICYATTAIRVDKAFGAGTLDLSWGSKDMILSRADQVNSNGVGDALIKHNLGVPVTQDDVWKGGLQKGAHIQLWWKVSENGKDLQLGHSLFFVDYHYDSNGKIDGFNYMDDHGYNNNSITKKGPLLRERWETSLKDRSMKAVNLKDKSNKKVGN